MAEAAGSQQAVKGISFTNGILGAVSFVQSYDGVQGDAPLQALDKDKLVMREYREKHNRVATHMIGLKRGEDAPIRKDVHKDRCVACPFASSERFSVVLFCFFP